MTLRTDSRALRALNLQTTGLVTRAYNDRVYGPQAGHGPHALRAHVGTGTPDRVSSVRKARIAWALFRQAQLDRDQDALARATILLRDLNPSHVEKARPNP